MVDGEVTTVSRVAAALLGQVGLVPADRLIDQPRELGGADPVRDRCHVVSTNPAASMLREWPMVSWATWRAFHAASSPETTRAQSFGSR